MAESMANGRRPGRRQTLLYLIQWYGWLLAFAACGIVSYLSIWQRGLLTDDYAFRAQVLNVETGRRSLFVPAELNRFMAFLVDVNLAGLMPEYELAVRLLAALCTAANALLLGFLVYRLVHTRLPAVVAAWLFLSPFYAHQAVLWTAAYPYIFSVFCALLYLHAALSGLTTRRAPWPWAALAVLCYVLATGFDEQVALSIAFVPVLAFAAARQHRLPDARVTTPRLAALVLVPAALAIAYVLLGYSGGDIVATRGGINLSLPHLLSQAEAFAARFVQFTWRPNTGLRLVNEALRVGARALLASLPALAWFAAAACLTLVAALLWQRDSPERSSQRAALALILGGAAWCAAAVFLPGILLTNQALVVRMYYVPMAGAAVGGAGLAWLLARRLPPSVGDRAALLAMGAVMLFSTVCMLGHARAYQARYQLDQRQLSTLADALPARYLPSDKPYVVAIELDERLFGGYDALSQTLIGVFQTGRSARAELRRMYRTTDINSVAPVGWVVRPVELDDGPAGQQDRVLVAGISVPVDHTILFAYRDGRTHIIESLVITQRDGQRRSVAFPLAQAMSADGLVTLQDYPVSQRGRTLAGLWKQLGEQ